MLSFVMLTRGIQVFVSILNDLGEKKKVERISLIVSVNAV